MSWYNVQAFIAKLNERLPGLNVRAPNEAEWEYAARAGTIGSRYGELEDIAWYSKNSGGETHPVAQKQPNAWGLHDMLGNVWEWCSDYAGQYVTGTIVDPFGPDRGYHRVIRGGSWGCAPSHVRAAYRFWRGPGYSSDDLGFRLARTHGTHANPE